VSANEGWVATTFEALDNALSDQQPRFRLYTLNAGMNKLPFSTGMGTRSWSSAGGIPTSPSTA
jgi:hypothetical protein